MTKPILIVDDDSMQRRMLSSLLLRELGLEACTAENGRKALDIIKDGNFRTIKLIILDLDMPVMGGMETLKILHKKYPFIPVILLTGSKDINDAVQAIKLGATDFLTKPYEANRVVVTVRNALKISNLSKEVSRLKNEKERTFTFENLIGYDNGLMPIINIGRKVAASNIPLLITGETGTGKEIFAKAIHGESVRAGKPFIAVNCGSIPAQLVESTLFGHEKGAFTGATEKVMGKFREAEGGTIFLDEIGELPLDAQVSLLRVLQQKEVEPVGSGKPVPINVRIISATNRDLQKEVDKGNFREDLFFRINILQIELPPLIDRKQDIIDLSNHFIEQFCASEGYELKHLSKTVEQKLINYNWPGNVRQLENTINRAIVMSDSGVLDIEHFTSIFSNEVQEKSLPMEILDKKYAAISLIYNDGEFKTIDEIELETIQFALEYFDNNITKAAKALSIARSTFYKKIKV